MRPNALTQLTVHAAAGLVLASTVFPVGAAARLAASRPSPAVLGTVDAHRAATSLPIAGFEIVSETSFRLVLATRDGNVPVTVRERGTFDGTTFFDIDLGGSLHVARVFRDTATGAPAWSWDERSTHDVLRPDLADAWTEGLLLLLDGLSDDLAGRLDGGSDLTTHGVKSKLIFGLIGAIGTVIGIADDLGLIGGGDPPAEPVTVEVPGDGNVTVVGDDNTIIVVQGGGGDDSGSDGSPSDGSDGSRSDEED